MLATLLTVAVLSTTGSGTSPLLPFIQNDFRRAAAEAARRDVPLFVDAWAPWCHSCASMHAFVYGDLALKKVSNQFVWLSVNTERPENAEFLEKYSVRAWPTLMVIDGKTLNPRARWLGSVDADELVRRLEAILAARRPDGVELTERLVLEAQLLEAEGRRVEALELYRRALAQKPTGPKRAAVVEALAELLTTHNARECAELGIREVPHMPTGSHRAAVAATALSCALNLPSDMALRRATESQVRLEIEAGENTLLTDDRSALFELLVRSREADKDSEEARELGIQWAAFLDAAATEAKEPSARTVFDAHRILAYEAAGQLERVVPLLTQSEKDFPHDYNPPARLAYVYLKLDKPAEALAATLRARKLVYGPRTLRVMLLQVEAQERLNRRDAAKETLRDAEALVARLPSGQRQPSHWKLLDDARAKLDR